ncbi:TPA: hypothetical protein I7217_06225 [Vibrio vulnificus]|uniref:hypothetical protein n=1 Tax=Vibrio vulnificus TaxID=672 RepID=UPI001A2C1B36|nr:hypothetical protein [Vibrio vulnificus]WIL74410.1 hypothetical protein QPX65_00845 [Vibrio vulnificus]HAS6044886.1 hypothetical protein [Vibrio vulnificus]HAT8503979.1 hypothetical protein [Vibrio vulnificus]
MAFIKITDFSLVRDNIDIAEQVSGISTGVIQEALTALLKQCGDLTIHPFQIGNFNRLSEHFRSICFTDGNYDFAIKGTEPLLSDAMQYLESFSNRIDLFTPSVGHRFIFSENKIPFVFTYQEALKEVSISQKMIFSYYSTYAELPLIPIPLAVCKFRLPDPFVGKVREKYSMDCSSIEAGIVLYSTSGHPARVGHFDRFFNNNFKVLGQKLESRSDYASCNKWLSTLFGEFTRWVNLGFVPAEVGKSHLGFAVKPQNVGLDGGLFDIGSFSLAEGKSDKELLGDLYLSVSALCDTICEHVSLDFSINGEHLKRLFYPLVLTAVLDRWPNKMGDGRTLSLVQSLQNGDILELAHFIDSCRYQSEEFGEIVI